jgi:hypothetical protein
MNQTARPFFFEISPESLGIMCQWISFFLILLMLYHSFSMYRSSDRSKIYRASLLGPFAFFYPGFLPPRGKRHLRFAAGSLFFGITFLMFSNYFLEFENSP